MLRFVALLVAVVAVSAMPAASLQVASATPTLNVTMLSKKFLETADIRVDWVAPAPIGDDWVSVWHVDVNATYIRYANVTAGTGSVKFTLLNTRRPYYVRYMRGSAVLATSQQIMPEVDMPMEIRLTAMSDDNGGADPTTMRVSWTMAHEALSVHTGLLLGKTPTHLSEVHLADASKITTYTHKELNERIQYPHIPIRSTMFKDIEVRGLGPHCPDGCWNDPTACTLFTDPGAFVNVDLTNLEPDTVYYYSVGTVGGRMSTVRRFITRPLPNATEARILYIGDGGIGGEGSSNPDAWPGPFNFGGSVSGSIYSNDPPRNLANYVWKTLAGNINKASSNELPHMQVWVGDASYTRGWSSQPWSFWHYQTQDILSVTAAAVLQGNHEFDHGANNLKQTAGGDSGGEAGVVFGRRFLQSVHKTWWFRRVGPIAYVGLDSEAEAGPQLNFLRSLEKDELFTSAPWRVASFHRPPIHTAHNGMTVYLRQHYGEFLTNHFDLVVYGHDHFYRRWSSLGVLDCTVINPCKMADGQPCRPVFHNYRNLKIKPSAGTKCFLGSKAKAENVTACKASCAGNISCTGVSWDSSNNCQLLKCDASDYSNSEYDGGYNLFPLERKKGKPPVLVLNGNAGAEYNNPDHASDYRVEVTKLSSSGWGTIRANQTHLVWHQWEAVRGVFSSHNIETDNRIIDELVLTKP